MAKSTVKKAQKKVAKKAAKKRGSAKKAQPQPEGPPQTRKEAEAFIKRHKLEKIAPKAAAALRRGFTE